MKLSLLDFPAYYINIDACGSTVTDNDSAVVQVEPQPSINISAVNGVLQACEGDLPIQLEPGNLQTNACVLIEDF